MSLIIELNASANAFYLLKHLLLLNLVIFKLKCHNLIVNENFVLNASYVCLLHSHFIENHLIWIMEDGPLISEVVLSHQWDMNHDGENVDRTGVWAQSECKTLQQKNRAHAGNDHHDKDVGCNQSV
jgi:hypothetical protein